MIRSFILGLGFLFLAQTQAQVSETPARTISTGKLEVTALAVAPKGDRILVGLSDGAMMVDLGTEKKIYTFDYAEDKGTAVYYAAFNDNGEYAVLMGHTGKRTVWNNTNGKQEKVITSFRWIPDPRSVKAMGLDMSNSTFDRFYQQTEVTIGYVRVASTKNGKVEFFDAEGKVIRTIAPENKDQHHLAPLLIWNGNLLIGTDSGDVLFYTIS